jgi:hypothetical protein
MCRHVEQERDALRARLALAAEALEDAERTLRECRYSELPCADRMAAVLAAIKEA